MFLQIDPRNAGNLTAINFQAIEIAKQEVDGFSTFGRTSADQRDMFDKVSGTTAIRRQLSAGRPVSAIVQSWDSGITRWAIERQPYLLYGMKPTKGANKPASVVADATTIAP